MFNNSSPYAIKVVNLSLKETVYLSQVGDSEMPDSDAEQIYNKNTSKLLNVISTTPYDLPISQTPSI